MPASDMTVREQALHYAVALTTDVGMKLDDSEIVHIAEKFYKFLALGIDGRTPTSISIAVGPVTEQSQGAVNTVQMTDSQEVTLTVSEADSKGAPLQDTLTWSVDNSTAITLNPSTDTQSCTCVAGMPGSAVVTVTDGVLSATVAIDVVPGDVATISVAEGTPTEQTPATPTP